MTENRIATLIPDACFKIHRELGPGYNLMQRYIVFSRYGAATQQKNVAPLRRHVK